MIATALELQLEEYSERPPHLREEDGDALVGTYGKAKPRRVSLRPSPVELQPPRVNHRRTDHRFTGKILPPLMQRSPHLDDALPVLHVHRQSCRDFEQATPVLLRAYPTGRSHSTTTPLTRVWQYVHVRAGGVYPGVRLCEDNQLAYLVLVGVLADGKKEIIVLAHGYWEPADSWHGLPRDLERQGIPAPKLVIGDGDSQAGALRLTGSVGRDARCSCPSYNRESATRR